MTCLFINNYLNEHTYQNSICQLLVMIDSSFKALHTLNKFLLHEINVR